MTLPLLAQQAFLQWVETRVVPNKVFYELEYFDTGDAYEHMFLSLNFMLGGYYVLAAKHLRIAISKDPSEIGRLPEMGALDATSIVWFKKHLREIVDSKKLENVFEQYMNGCIKKI